jgi:hypothetical protein
LGRGHRANLTEVRRGAARADPERRELLSEHNRRIVRWAEASDPDVQMAIKVLGWIVDIETLTTPDNVRWSWDGLAAKFSGKHGLPAFSARTLRRHVTEKLEPAGLVKVARSAVFGPDHKRRQMPNTFRIVPSMVLVNGRTRDGFDFFAPLEAGNARRSGQLQSVTGQLDGQVSRLSTLSRESSTSLGDTGPASDEVRKSRPASIEEIRSIPGTTPADNQVSPDSLPTAAHEGQNQNPRRAAPLIIWGSSSLADWLAADAAAAAEYREPEYLKRYNRAAGTAPADPAEEPEYLKRYNRAAGTVPADPFGEELAAIEPAEPVTARDGFTSEVVADGALGAAHALAL